MRRILCWLGFHKLEWVRHWSDGSWIHVCGCTKIRDTDLWQGRP